MSTQVEFGLQVLVGALVGVAAVLSSRLSERLRIPTPAFFLFGAALAADLWPRLGGLSYDANERIVTVALAIILFDGGLHIGWRRFRSAAGAIVWVGVAGTLVTTLALAAAAHTLFGFDWRTALLLGTALAPTDPAVVFSVLGRREITGRSGVLLEGESGANDPVGIALLVAVLAATGGGFGTVGGVAWEFVVQMAVGAAVGAVGGWLIGLFMRRVPLPSEGLYALRVLACALAVYGVATVAHGSGFLAVLVAGILLGDQRAPYKREIEGFHSALASLAEIVAFVLLGLSVSLRDLASRDTWLVGLGLALLLTFVIRPVLVGLVLWPVKLHRGERIFVLWTGLKGAVPILLGAFIVQSGIADAHRVYEIIFVVVGFSVIVQGGLVPVLARWCRIPLRIVEPEPWSLAQRFREEPAGLHHFRVRPGSPADGTTLSDLPLGEDSWISLVVREGRPLTAVGDTTLHAGDELTLLAPADRTARLRAIFHPAR